MKAEAVLRCEMTGKAKGVSSVYHLNCEKRSGGTLEARRRNERRRRENRGEGCPHLQLTRGSVGAS